MLWATLKNKLWIFSNEIKKLENESIYKITNFKNSNQLKILEYKKYLNAYNDCLADPIFNELKWNEMIENINQNLNSLNNLEKISNSNILSGMGELLDQKQKSWVKLKLVSETIFLIRLRKRFAKAERFKLILGPFSNDI